MITLLRPIILFTSFMLLTSCSDDDIDNTTNETENSFPIKLVFNEQADNFTFYKNGEETVPSENEIETFYTLNQEILTEFDAIAIDTFYEFTDSTLLTTNTFSDGNEATVEYNFQNSILNSLNFDGNNIPLADGSYEELNKTLIIVYYNNSSTGSYGLLANNEIFPLTFESTKGFYHNFETINEISENEMLYLFTREYKFTE